MNNYDDSLRFAVKLPQGSNFFMHDVESREDVKAVFEAIKGHNLLDLKSDQKKGIDLSVFEYKLRKKPMDVNGIVAVSAGDGLMNFIEFENPEKSSAQLKTEMTLFLMTHLVENK